VAGKTVLILGGGTGGLVAAQRLRRMLDRAHHVVLVDRTPLYSFAPSYTWVMLGKRTRRISRDLRSLTRKGIEFVLGEVRKNRCSGQARHRRRPGGSVRLPYCCARRAVLI
jgi:sulfide:quinone oxidoreductase